MGENSGRVRIMRFDQMGHVSPNGCVLTYTLGHRASFVMQCPEVLRMIVSPLNMSIYIVH
jgi:hypothetical protein